MTDAGNTLVASSACKARVHSRRHTLLAGTAFAGGVFALMLAANPQSAWAECTVTALPNTVSCAATTTTDTTNTNGGTPSSTDRTQLFDNGGVINPGATGATINPGATVSGFGLSIEDQSNPAAGINVNNLGAVDFTDGIAPTTGTTNAVGPAALNITSGAAGVTGGSITYNDNANASVIATTAFVEYGMAITSNGGSITLGNNGAISGLYVGNANDSAVYLNSVPGAGDTGATGGTVTATIGAATFNEEAGAALEIAAGNTSAVNMTIGAASFSHNAAAGAGTGDGIDVDSAGSVSITSAATFGATGTGTLANGIVIGADAQVTGSVTLTQTGNIFVSGAGATGISNNSAGNATITLGTGATLAVTTGSTGSYGINDSSMGTAAGTVHTIIVSGVIDPPDIGVANNQAGAAAVVSVTAGGSITANDVGIFAATTGSGAVTVTTDAGSVIDQGTGTGVQNTNLAAGSTYGGIVTSAASGTTSINVGGSIAAAGFGISASATGAGAININTGAGNISSTTSNAIGATSAGGAISVTTGTGLVSGVGGINASNTASGMISLSVGSGGVTGTGSNAITTTAATGDTSINTAGAVQATGDIGGDGINASATSGNITIAANASVSSTNGNGITASTSTGGAISISTNDAATVFGGGDGINAAVTGGGGGITINTGQGGLVSVGDGAGIDASTTTGKVSITAGDVSGGTFGINAGTNNGNALAGGNITINADGTTVTGGAGTAIQAVASGTGASAIDITATGAIGGGTGIHASSNSTGSTSSITITTDSTVTADGINTNNYGIAATLAGTGSVTIQANGNVTDNSFEGTAYGIYASTSGGGINITTAAGATIKANGNSTSTAIYANSAGGNINGTINGAVINGSVIGGPAIVMNAGGGTIALTSNNMVSAGAGTAVTLSTTGAGNINYTTENGPVTGAADGIAASITTGTTGGITINADDNVAGANGGSGISATITGGSGNVQVSGTGSASGSGGSGAGVFATTTGSGNVIVNLSGVIQDLSGASGVFAGSATGNVNVVTGNNVTGGASGIDASTGGAGAGTVVINTTLGTVSGGVIGIDAFSSAGLISITAGVVTANGAGIAAQSVSGNVVVQTSGNVTGGTNAGAVGIFAGDGTTGSVTISTSSASNVSGGTGIVVSTSAGTATGSSVTITADGTVTGTAGDAIDVTTGAGDVTIQTFGAINPNIANPAGNGIAVTSGTGNITVTNFAAVSGDPGVSMSSGGNITYTAAANVSGTLDGIATVETAGGITSITVNPNITVTGVGTGNAGIAASTVTGPIGIVNFGTVTNATGIGVSLTQTGAGSAVLTNEAGGLITGLGTALNPVINIASTTGPTTINNLSGGIGGVGGTIESVSGAPNDVAVASAGGPVTINNASLLVGDLLLSGAGSSTVNNGTCSNGVCTPGTWSVYGTNTFANGGDTVTNSIGSTISILNPGPSTFTFGTGANTLTNDGIVNSNGVVSFLALQTINNLLTNQSPNSGIFNVGSSLGALGEQTNFSTGATNTTAGGVQTVTNTGTFNIMALQAQTGAYRGSLNFVGGGGSTFSNAGGTINMQLDNGAPNNAVTLNLTSMGGTSDLNYTYVFTNPALTSAASGFNFVGDTSAQQPPSRLLVDTQIGAPGSTSDRLVIGGNATGVTGISVNDVDGGPGAYNPTGITLVKVEGTAATGSSPTAFNLAGVTSPNSTDVYVQPNSTYPLGAIEKGPWIYPLIYNTHNDPAFMLVGLPGPFLVQTTAFPTAALNIFDATAATWYDQQESTRNCMRHGFAAAGLAYGGGADLAVKGEAPELPACRPGVWTKLIGSWTNQGGDINLGQLGALFNGIQYNTGFHQGTGGALVGVDYAKAELLSREDSLVLSLMGGYINSTASFDAPNAFATGTPFPAQTTSLSFSGGTIAGSATYMNRGFFADALIKADFLTMDVGNIPSVVTPTGSAAAYSNTWGAAGDIGYRFERGRYFAEPIVSLEWAQNRLGNIALPAAATTVMFPNNDMFNVGGGARFGGTLMDDRVHYLEASIIGRVWDRAFENNTVNIANLGPTLTLNQNYAGAYGETGLQLDWLNRYSGWSAYLRADAKFSDQFQTYGGTAGLHYGF